MQNLSTDNKSSEHGDEGDFWKKKTEQSKWSKPKIIILCALAIVLYILTLNNSDTNTTKSSNAETTTPNRAAGKSKNMRYRNAQSGDKGDYFVVNQSSNGVLYRAVSKRVGPSGTSYTRVEVNCRNKSYKVLGEGMSMSTINNAADPKMTRAIQGSSKYDLVNFICP